MDLRLKHPFPCIIAGPTGSGKTVLVRKLLANYRTLTTISDNKLKVVYCYGQYQSGLKNNIPNVEIIPVAGLVSEKFLQEHKPHIIILDDLMSEVSGNREVTALFTKKSHHNNVSVIFIIQNFFHQGKEMRTISLNAHYIILLKNARDKSQIARLGEQIFPGQARFFKEAYDDAVSKPFGYILLDVSPTGIDEYRIRTRIFPDENVKGVPMPIVYQNNA